MSINYPCFTVKRRQGLANRLVSAITLFNSVMVVNGRSYDDLERQQHVFLGTAIWDTGATASSISAKVVARLELPVLAMTNIATANGIYETSVHYVDIGLPNKVVVPKLEVSMGNFGEDVDFDVLIGMDVITRGDFSVSNYQGVTAFSFRCPSLECIDYVANPFKPQPIKNPTTPGRNALCPCGSGKKYKNCCGQ